MERLIKINMISKDFFEFRSKNNFIYRGILEKLFYFDNNPFLQMNFDNTNIIINKEKILYIEILDIKK